MSCLRKISVKLFQAIYVGFFAISWWQCLVPLLLLFPFPTLKVDGFAATMTMTITQLGNVDARPVSPFLVDSCVC